MPTYIGFSTINANKPKTTNARPGSAAGTGNTLNSLVFGKKSSLSITTTSSENILQKLEPMKPRPPYTESLFIYYL